jgi:hypothetical protein
MKFSVWLDWSKSNREPVRFFKTNFQISVDFKSYNYKRTHNVIQVACRQIPVYVLASY